MNPFPLDSGREAEPGGTLICLHCSGSSGRQWDALAAPFADRFEVLAPDLLGYGKDVRWNAGEATSLDAEANHLAALLAARPGGVHLLGHSYGGAVALQMALRWPTFVKSLTLYEPVRFALLAAHPATSRAHAEITHVGRTIVAAVAAGSQHEGAEVFFDYWGGAGTWASMDERRRGALAARLPKIAAEFEALFGDRVPASAYAQLKMPVRLLGGSASPAPARETLRRLASAIPHADYLVLRGLGHMAPVDEPARVREMLPAWLRAAPAASAPAASAARASAPSRAQRELAAA